MSAIAARTAVLSLLLSLLVTAAFILHFATGWTTFEQEDLEFGFRFISSVLVLVLPASIPLTLPVSLLYRRSHLAAWLCSVVLVPLSIVGFFFGGLLLSEFAIITVAVLVALPAWLALLVLALWSRRTL